MTKVVRQGRPTDYIPKLAGDDIVYVCGAPLMVDAVREISKAAGAICYGEPFLPQTNEPEDLWSRAKSWITGETPAFEPPPQPQGRRPRQRPIFVAVPGDLQDEPVRRGPRGYPQRLQNVAARWLNGE